MSQISFLSGGKYSMHGQVTSPPNLADMVQIAAFFSDAGEELAYVHNFTTYFTYHGCWFRKKGKLVPEMVGQLVVSQEDVHRYFKLFKGEYLPCFHTVKHKYYDKILSYDRTEYRDVYAFQAPRSTNRALKGTTRCILKHDTHLEDPDWNYWGQPPKVTEYIYVRNVNTLKVTSEYSFFLSGEELEFMNERQLKISGLL